MMQISVSSHKQKGQAVAPAPTPGAARGPAGQKGSPAPPQQASCGKREMKKLVLMPKSFRILEVATTIVEV